MKTSDTDVKTKSFAHSQSKTSDNGARPKTVEAISKSKVPASTTDADIKADIDTEQVTIDSLRQNPKLQKQVKKELSKLGLKARSLKDEYTSSESESSDTSSTSDSDMSKKKKKKHKSKKKRPILKPLTHLALKIVILRRRKSISQRNIRNQG